LSSAWHILPSYPDKTLDHVTVNVGHCGSLCVIVDQIAPSLHADVLDWYQTNLPQDQQQQQQQQELSDVEAAQPEDRPGGSSKQEQHQQLLPHKHQGKRLKRRMVRGCCCWCTGTNVYHVL
jgi:hypothetical protein